MGLHILLMSTSEVRNPAPPESTSQKSLVKDILQALPRAFQVFWHWAGEQARAPGDRLKAVSYSAPELLARATHWPGPRFRAIAKLSQPTSMTEWLWLLHESVYRTQPPPAG